MNEVDVVATGLALSNGSEAFYPTTYRQDLAKYGLRPSMESYGITLGELGLVRVRVLPRRIGFVGDSANSQRRAERHERLANEALAAIGRLRDRLHWLIEHRRGNEEHPTLFGSSLDSARAIASTLTVDGLTPVDAFCDLVWALILDSGKDFYSRVWQCTKCKKRFLASTRHPRVICDSEACQRKAHAACVGRKRTNRTRVRSVELPARTA